MSDKLFDSEEYKQFIRNYSRRTNLAWAEKEEIVFKATVTSIIVIVTAFARTKLLQFVWRKTTSGLLKNLVEEGTLPEKLTFKQAFFLWWLVHLLIPTGQNPNRNT